MTGTSTASSDPYWLPRNPTESERLNQQHTLIKSAFDGLLVPSHVQLEDGAAVLDSATGTGVMLRDFVAMHPSVKFSKVVGCDISADQFPPESDRAVGNVKLDLRVQNVLEPFPSDLVGSFDLVNQRFVVAGLKDAQWSTALENLVSLLKPGGYLNIVDVILFCDEKNDIFKTVNKVFGALTGLGHRFDCVGGAEKFMKDANFEDIQASRVKWTSGVDNPRGEAFGRAAADNFTSGVAGIYNNLLAKAPHLLPEEIRSEEDGRVFLLEVKKAFYQGGSVPLGMVTGRKSQR